MADDGERVRTSWFGMGGRPELPYYLRSPSADGARTSVENVRRMSPSERRQELGRWTVIAVGFAIGVGLGLALLRN